MFFHVFRYRLKILLRKKVVIFWTLIFPIILSTFFSLAFSNLSKIEKLEIIDIAMVEKNETATTKKFMEVIQAMSNSGKDQVFHLKKVNDEKEAISLLENNKIAGYYILDEQIEIKVKSNGINQTIMKSISDQFLSEIKAFENIMDYHPEAFLRGMKTEIVRNRNYVKEMNENHVDFSVIYFYTVIGMVCIYGGFFGIDAAYEIEANQSKCGARVSVAPTHKLKVLCISLLVGLLVQYVEILILLAYLIFILKVEFGTQIIPILFLTLLGSLAGVSFGTLIGVCNRKSNQVKTGIFLCVTMTCCFLAGMMMLDMRTMIANHAPIINYINPVSMITDALYALYYYTTFDRYFFNIWSLIAFSLITLAISYHFIRRKTYDSI